jgi:hypothetical protein
MGPTQPLQISDSQTLASFLNTDDCLAAALWNTSDSNTNATDKASKAQQFIFHNIKMISEENKIQQQTPSTKYDRITLT